MHFYRNILYLSEIAKVVICILYVSTNEEHRPLLSAFAQCRAGDTKTGCESLILPENFVQKVMYTE